MAVHPPARAAIQGTCVGTASGEPLPGTAPQRRLWALVEHPGPWGRDAVADAPWPQVPGDVGFGRTLQAAVDTAGVRLVLARTPGRRLTGAPPSAPLVIVCLVGPGGWVASVRLDSPLALLDLDWAALAAAPGRPRGWADPGPVWAICTHGTRDLCCAVLGRPLAAAFRAAEPDATWEISHSGGHRFSGVLLALPEGLCYGRVQPGDVAELVAARARGAVVPRLLRGRMHLTHPMQAAEAALLDHLGTAALDAVTAVSERPVPVGVRTLWRDGAGVTWQVDVEHLHIADRPGSCGKPPEPASAWHPGVPVAVGAGRSLTDQSASGRSGTSGP